MARELQALAQSMVPKAGKDVECPSDRGLERAEVRAREPWGPGRGSRVSFRERRSVWTALSRTMTWSVFP